jgi:hypothetical protein
MRQRFRAARDQIRGRLDSLKSMLDRDPAAETPEHAHPGSEPDA